MSVTSNIRVYVQWKEQTVFAGEDVECIITFKNVARDESRASTVNGFMPRGERQRKITPFQVPLSDASMSRNPAALASQARGHRPTLSLNVPSSNISSPHPSSPWSGRSNGSYTPGNAHKRSVSILSVGSDALPEEPPIHGSALPTIKPTRNHARSASLQILPNRARPPPSPLGHRSSTQASPMLRSTSPLIPLENGSDPSSSLRSSRRTSARPSASGTPDPGRPLRKPSGSFSQNFKFPAASPQIEPPSPNPQTFAGSSSNNKNPVPLSRQQSPKPPELSGPNLEHLNPTTKVLAGSSMNATPRSSGEFYSLSNNSTETLASEYGPQLLNKAPQRPNHLRSISHINPTSHPQSPENLMMGYVQIQGSFTLDGSLINQAPFEEVKRKGVVGGHGGGGVVGVEKSKRESGIFGAFGWSNIGESIGSLLGAGELSSIKEMRGIASAKSIPLISTPQSILFVDLRLAPGESRSYTYSFTLPRGLPASHKGKAIKVSYNLVIGTQRAGTLKSKQLVSQVEVPFRVFGAVNGRGEVLGHDLMSPYIILRDLARTQSIPGNMALTDLETFWNKKTSRPKQKESSLEDFLSYADTLLEAPRRSSSYGLISPTDVVPPHRMSSGEGGISSKEAIDFAILRSNARTATNQSTNRFEIARNGRRVAVLMLARPAYRLGETLTAVIDFKNADLPCYSVHAALESSEKVDPAIALRSGASIQRVTRRVHASQLESTLFARRVSFRPSIPVNASPEFLTSGVSLEWRLRVEFVTPSPSDEEEEDEQQAVEGGDGEGRGAMLLEEVSRDDRALVMAAVEGLACESFEVAVPIKVYGAVAAGVNAPVEGLSV
ncbi:Rgp1-domain-containing protein [Xylona heveae TC161]|uniref:Rgp1-domain-containing protein n=1 Tax=Xylona heveae (strain CBS 132557 / TC161) TaxID=1328760 RepID=A0A165A5T9_XYLHT|nr:Rgp1-domain-containing protein [Xylona heveae TC161]KZF19993.1 Rgp1-domain-containing protein [Xylona heveae TC161]